MAFRTFGLLPHPILADTVSARTTHRLGKIPPAEVTSPGLQAVGATAASASWNTKRPAWRTSRRWYARMLIDRDAPGDRGKARELPTEGQIPKDEMLPGT